MSWSLANSQRPQQQLLPFPKMQHISVKRAADYLACSRTMVYRLIESGALQGYRLTPLGWWRVYRDSVVQYLNRRRADAL